MFFELLNQVETFFLLANMCIKEEWQDMQIRSLKVVILLYWNNWGFLFSGYLYF